MSESLYCKNEKKLSQLFILPSILSSTNRFGGGGFERMKEKINRIKPSVVIHEEGVHGLQ